MPPKSLYTTIISAAHGSSGPVRPNRRAAVKTAMSELLHRPASVHLVGKPDLVRELLAIHAGATQEPPPSQACADLSDRKFSRASDRPRKNT